MSFIKVSYEYKFTVITQNNNYFQKVLTKIYTCNKILNEIGFQYVIIINIK
ncbi:hypothetical protein UT300013_07840 [Paraclostridium sordellii]